MRSAIAALRSILVVLAGIALAGCEGISSSGNTSAGPSTYTVGVTVSGLTGTGLALQNNGGANIPIAANGSFTFPAAVVAGDTYSVSVFAQPDSPAQTCVVANGGGTASANVINVTVTCALKTTTDDTVGGTVTGVQGSGMVLQMSDGSTITIAANGTFTFPVSVTPGTAYAISVLTVPTQPYQDCTILNGSGTTGDVNIGNITISCQTNTNTPYTIGGTVAWQTGSGSLTLQVNGLDSTTVTSNGTAAVPFTFSTPIPSGSAYVVTAQEPGASGQSHTCVLSNASGVVGAANITNVAIVCGAVAQLAVTTQGLSGQGLTVQDGDGTTFPITGSGTASFPTTLTPGQAYNVVVTGQPSNPSQTCTVANGTGTVPPNGVISASISCTTNTYVVGGTVTGLPNPLTGNQLILSDNGTDSLTLGANGAFQFAIPVASNGTYAVTVTTQPGFLTQLGNLTQTQYVCNVTGATGTVINAPINSVVVTCIQPDGFAYVTNASDNTVTDFVIDANTGALLPFGTAATGTTPTSVTAFTGGVFTNFGSSAYVANGGSSNLTSYSLDVNTGVLTSPSTFAQAGAIGASSITLGAYDFTNNVNPLYVTNPGSGNISVVQAANTGALTFTNTLYPAGAKPVTAAFAQIPTDFIAAVSTTDSTLSAYSTDATGTLLTQASTFPVATGSQPTAVATPSLYNPNTGSFTVVYVATSGDNTISFAAASVSPTNALLTIGALTAGVTLPSGTGPITVAVDTNYDYLYAVNSAGVWILSLNVSTGAPTLVSTTPVPVGTAPSSAIVFGGFNSDLLYVINSGDGTVSAFTINSTSGALTPVTGSPFKTGNGPSSIFAVFRPNLAG
jgi:6-phosphogluconolactonase (cycloisomerase 2 family)